MNTNLKARDSRGYQYSYGTECGPYDDVDFTARMMICACGGGFTWNEGSDDERWDATAPYCYDDIGNGQKDSSGYSCSEYNTTSFVVNVTTPTLPLRKCVVLAEAERQEFARTRTTEPRTEGGLV